MNSLTRNKKKARTIARKNGHKIGRFYMVCRFALSRCVKCGKMLYVAGKSHNHLYGKLVTGDVTKDLCQRNL